MPYASSFTSSSSSGRRPDLDQALDVERHFTAKVTLHLERAIDHLAKPVDLVFGEVPDTGVRVDIGLLEDLLAGTQPDPKDVCKGNLNALLARNIDARNSCHRVSPAAACA